MNSIPTSSEQIPPETGLVQTVDCKGIAKEAVSGKRLQPLDQPVSAQITTFANGVRHVCCFHAGYVRSRGDYCLAYKDGQKIAPCIYTWENPK